MAELIMTDDERAADSLAAWSDESIGKLVRKSAAGIERLRRKADGRAFVAGYALAAQFVLINDARDRNAGVSRFVLTGTSEAGVPGGDWEVIVRRRSPGAWTRIRDVLHVVRYLGRDTRRRTIRGTAGA